MGPFGDLFADFIEMHLHRLGVGPGQNQSSAGAALWADGSEDVGVLIALIGRQAWPCAFPSPNADLSVLLADARFVLEPNLYRFAFGQVGYVGSKGSGEVFLNVSIT